MEVKSRNANRVGEIAQPKKAVLLAAMVKSALARTIEDIMIMIVKKIGKINRAGKTKLDEYPKGLCRKYYACLIVESFPGNLVSVTGLF